MIDHDKALAILFERHEPPPPPPPPTSAEMLARAERLLRGVLPELDGEPIYLLSADEAGFEGCEIGGIAGHFLDLLLRPRIGDRWRGRGPLAIVNTAYYAATTPPSRLADTILAIATHEMAHCLAGGWAGRGRAGEETEPVPDCAHAVVAARFKRPMEDLSESERRSDALWHGPPWVRAALHLQGRLELRGAFVSAWRTIGPGRSMSDADRYAAVLRDEVEQMRDLPIETVLTSPLPRAFAEMWERDSRRLAEPQAEPGQRGAGECH